jgi:hypothetical protein
MRRVDADGGRGGGDNHFKILKVKVKVKQSLYSPGQALRVIGGSGSQISRQHMKEVRLSALGTARLYPQQIFLVLISARG